MSRTYFSFNLQNCLIILEILSNSNALTHLLKYLYISIWISLFSCKFCIVCFCIWLFDMFILFKRSVIWSSHGWAKVFHILPKDSGSGIKGGMWYLSPSIRTLPYYSTNFCTLIIVWMHGCCLSCRDTHTQTFKQTFLLSSKHQSSKLSFYLVLQRERHSLAYSGL